MTNSKDSNNSNKKNSNSIKTNYNNPKSKVIEMYSHNNLYRKILNRK